jgi:hypothetical protein
MKRSLLSKLCIIFMVAFAYHGNLIAQVGINTTTPQAGSMLDIDSADKGMLVPRVDIADLSTIAPITGGATESLLVYNTNVTTGKGFHFWTGTIWFPFIGNDWKTGGNAGTTLANFVGTVDNVDLSFRTNNLERFRMTSTGYFRAFSDGSVATPLFQWSGDTNTGFYHPGADQFGLVTNGVERFRIPNANQVYAMVNGSNSAPFYSWDTDNDSGLWRSAADRINISVGGREMVEFNENGANSEVVFNDGGDLTNFRVESDNEANTLFVSSANDNVGIGTNNPNMSAQLDMTDTDRGILINRVALLATNNASPVTSPATGLFVYNTANASSGSTEVLPGFYFWNGSQWVAMGGTGGKDWSLEGNAGTSLAANFLGTTDNTTMNFRTNNIERMRIINDGRVSINNAAPFGVDRFSVTGASGDYAVNAYASGAGVGVYAENTGSGETTVSLNFGTGLGTFSYSANTHGLYATTAYTGGAFLTGGIIGWGTGNDGANGVLAVTDKQVSTSSNMGMRAVSGSTTSISSSQVMNVGVNTNATDLALYAISEGPITSNGNMEAARFQTNYTGSAINLDARDPRAQLAGYTNASQVGAGNMYYGGYLYSGGSNANSSYAYAGARFAGTNYKIIGNGAVSTIINGVDGESKVMFASEAPEVLFEDYGTGTLLNGSASIAIDPTFTNNISVSDEHPLKVFIQLEGDCNGVYVTNKTATGFLVKELNSGTSNVNFSWHIVANRKDEIGGNSENSSMYSNLRFPDAPDSIKPTLNKAKETQNVTGSILSAHTDATQLNN